MTWLVQLNEKVVNCVVRDPLRLLLTTERNRWQVFNLLTLMRKLCEYKNFRASELQFVLRILKKTVSPNMDYIR